MYLLCTHVCSPLVQFLYIATSACTQRVTAINISQFARSSWRRLSKCVFVLALSRTLDPVGAPYSVRGYLRWDRILLLCICSAGES